MDVFKSDKQTVLASESHAPKPEEPPRESTCSSLNQTSKGMGDSSEVQDSGIGVSLSSPSISELPSIGRSPQSTETLPLNNFSTPLNARDVAVPLSIPEGNVSEIVQATSSVASTSASLSASTSASNSALEILRGSRRLKKRDRVCSYCGKTFDRPSLLQRHILSHTGERPFPCQYCDKAFSTRSGVNTHERIHTGYKPYVCQTCGRRFAAGSNYIFHAQLHTNTRRHRCDMCPKAFVTPGDLRRHKYSHTGDWPFRCSVCNRGFAAERSLTNHKAIHTGVKPYPCQLCDKSYTQGSSLKTHMRLHQQDLKTEKDVPSTSNWEAPPQLISCSSRQSTQQATTTSKEKPSPEAPDQAPVFQTLDLLMRYTSVSPSFNQPLLGNPNSPLDDENQVQELQKQLSHLQVQSVNELLPISSRSAFVDLRQRQTPLRPRRLPLHPSSSPSSRGYGRQWQRPRPVSPEQAQPLDLSTKKRKR